MANMPARLEAAIAAVLAEDKQAGMAVNTLDELRDSFVEARGGQSGLWERLLRQND